MRKYFTLTETDLQEVAVCRGVVNKLCFAVQLCTLRWQGYFLGDTRGLPTMVLETLARQLSLLAMSIDVTRRTRRSAGNTWSVSVSTCCFNSAMISSGNGS